MTERSVCHSRSIRHSLYRVTGAVVFALFAYQTTAFAWTRCGAQDAGGMSSSMEAMTLAGHGSPGTGMPDAPRSDHRSDCDHSLPVGGCSLGGGCVVALPGVLPLMSGARTAPTREYLAPTELALSLEFAPDTPPPRA